MAVKAETTGLPEAVESDLIMVLISPDTYNRLDSLAKKRNVETVDVLNVALDSYLKSFGE